MKVIHNTGENTESCNCRNKNNCLLDRKFLIPNIIYKARINFIQPKYKEKNYIGTAETEYQMQT